MERDRKKERTKRVKGSDGGGSKKAAQAAAGAMVAGVPAAMPVSEPLCFIDLTAASVQVFWCFWQMVAALEAQH